MSDQPVSQETEQGQPKLASADEIPASITEEQAQAIEKDAEDQSTRSLETTQQLLNGSTMEEIEEARKKQAQRVQRENFDRQHAGESSIDKFRIARHTNSLQATVPFINQLNDLANGIVAVEATVMNLAGVLIRAGAPTSVALTRDDVAKTFKASLDKLTHKQVDDLNKQQMGSCFWEFKIEKRLLTEAEKQAKKTGADADGMIEERTVTMLKPAKHEPFTNEVNTAYDLSGRLIALHALVRCLGASSQPSIDKTDVPLLALFETQKVYAARVKKIFDNIRMLFVAFAEIYKSKSINPLVKDATDDKSGYYKDLVTQVCGQYLAIYHAASGVLDIIYGV